MPFTPEALAKRSQIVTVYGFCQPQRLPRRPCGSLTNDHPSGTESLKAGWKRAGPQGELHAHDNIDCGCPRSVFLGGYGSIDRHERPSHDRSRSPERQHVQR